MTLLPANHADDPCLRVLHLPLSAMDNVLVEPAGTASGLPEGALAIPSAGLILAATPCAAPLFYDKTALAAHHTGYDVMLVRTGLFPETLDMVTIDVVLQNEGPLVAMRELAFFRHCDGGLWLIRSKDGLALTLDTHGLWIGEAPPFNDHEERSAGLCRAAAEIVRLSNGRH